MMNHNWNTEDIIDHFTLLPPEISFLGSNDPHNHLGKALLLKYFQKGGRFLLRQLIYKKEDLVTDLDLGEQEDDGDDPYRYPLHDSSVSHHLAMITSCSGKWTKR